MSKHSTSAVTVPVPLNCVCAVAFHPVSLANGLLDFITAKVLVTKLPPIAVSPKSQRATELPTSLVKISPLVYLC